VNRHADERVLFDTNIALVERLIAALEKTGSRAHVIFASSTQEERDNPYGRSKKAGRTLLAQWAERSGAQFTGLLIPNVFGPFGLPFYNSVIATFSHQLNRGEAPKIEMDAALKLIYVGELAMEIAGRIIHPRDNPVDREVHVPHTALIKVSEILTLLGSYRNDYLLNHRMPAFKNTFELNLFNTFRSYTDLRRHFPAAYVQHTDSRGDYAELIRTGGGGQVSFSTTKPGITRGNHFHTRKIERFSVIKGEALVKLRKTGTREILEYRLTGARPSFVDMPVWYTHNITNTGTDDLYTVFWSSEFYNPGDPDTFAEEV
jgi:UDP-2-acetamido-2,6-beta-L-arabino-hexul-4-ose reductase